MRLRLPVTAILITGALAACDHPSPRQPTADEYAVWSVAVDALGASENHAYVVASSTSGVQFMVERELRDMRAYPPPGLKPEMVEDYAARNRTPVVVDGRKLVVRQVSAYAPLGGAAGRVQSFFVPGRATLSRPGFSADGRHAIVTVVVSCGSMCGSGGTLLLRRDADGVWRLEETLSSYKS